MIQPVQSTIENLNSRFSNRELVREPERLMTRFYQELAPQFDAESRTDIVHALNLMVELHGDEPPRDEGALTITHPLKVALFLLEELKVNNADIVISALLHDTIEDEADKLSSRAIEMNLASEGDSTAPKLYIEHLYGHRVAQLVAALSKPDLPALVQREQAQGNFRTPQAIKFDLYLNWFEQLLKGDLDAGMIKIGDLFTNSDLDSVRDRAFRKELRGKYGPALVFAKEFVRALPSSAHPLAVHRNRVIELLSTTYNQNFAERGRFDPSSWERQPPGRHTTR